MATSVTDIERPSDVPEKIGKYVIINRIGKGSTGMVYLSHDPYYRRDVAIKVYDIEEDENADKAKVSRKMFFSDLGKGVSGVTEKASPWAWPGVG